jgi:NAD(P)-dependent dehydrogenase (short-subunit alcohol dehydrogenase family)
MSIETSEDLMTNESNAVLITGATGGIGAATVKTLTQQGYEVFAASHRGGEFELDVTDPQSIQAAIKAVTERLTGGGLRAVVNNAGIIVQGPQELVPAADLQRQFAVNVLGAAEVTKAFLPLLRAGNGRVINVSAPTARLPIPFAGPIGASKAALESLSDALRIELLPWRIPVVVVVPGAVRTEIFAKAGVAAEAAMAAAGPDQVALYQQHLEALGTAMSKQKMAPPETVAETIARAVAAPHPKRRYLANSDVRQYMLLARLPAPLRERLLRRVLGL